MTMYSADTDIAMLLQTRGVGVVGYSIYTGEDQPEKPDNMVMIINTGSYQESDPTITMEYPTVQVITRGEKGGKQECYQRAQDINGILYGITDYKAFRSRYLQIIPTMPAEVDLGVDTLMRPLYGFNYSMIRTPYPYPQGYSVTYSLSDGSVTTT